MERAARSYKVTTGVVCDGFLPEALLDLSTGTRRYVMRCGAVWETAATSLYDDAFLDPKNVTSERPIALLSPWEWLREPEVRQWQEWHRVG